MRARPYLGAALMCVGFVGIWVLWESGNGLFPSSPVWRLTIALFLLLLLVLGVMTLYNGLAVGGSGRTWIRWGSGLLLLTALLRAWYTQSELKVTPTNARIRTGTSVTLTAVPMTAVERLLGRQDVSWRSADGSRAVVDVRLDSASGRELAVVTGKQPGRTTIFAVRGAARYDVRLLVENDSGSVPPRPCEFAAKARPTATDSTPAGIMSTPSTASRPGQEPPGDKPGAAKGDTGPAAHGAPTPLKRTTELRCLAGSIISPAGQPLGRVTVSLTALGGKSDTIWSQETLTDPVDGLFQFTIPWDDDSRSLTFALTVHEPLTESSPIWFVPTQWGLDTVTQPIDGRLLDAGIYRDFDVKLQYSSRSAFSILLLLLPAIVGLLSTVAYYSALRRDGMLVLLRSKGKSAEEHERDLVRNYVFGNAFVWGSLLGVLALLYAFRNVQEISLFGGAITVPIIAPIFAFLGVLVYAISVLAEEYLRRFGAVQQPLSQTDRSRLLLALANRIVIAPYVAIVAVVALRLQGPMVPLVAFFTGIWIEAVLGALKEIGDRLVRRPVVGDRTRDARRTPTPQVGVSPQGVPATEGAVPQGEPGTPNGLAPQGGPAVQGAAGAQGGGVPEKPGATPSDHGPLGTPVIGAEDPATPVKPSREAKGEKAEALDGPMTRAKHEPNGGAARKTGAGRHRGHTSTRISLTAKRGESGNAQAAHPASPARE